MKVRALFSALSFASAIGPLTACGGAVDSGDPERVAPNSSGAGQGDAPSAPALTGMPCSSLHGVVTLRDYGSSPYSTAAFSFELGTQDSKITHNDYDVLYEQNTFDVNMVTDDESFIVDLGDMALADAPETVDPNQYPTGQWHEHDAIDAHLNHIYYVRSKDGSGRLVSVFRVIGLEPGVRTTIEWMRSTDPDAMVLSRQCL